MAKQSYLYVDGFWERLEREIYKQNRTKAGLAKQCGFNRKVLIRTEHNNIYLPYFARLCNVLHVSADYLLFGKE